MAIAAGDFHTCALLGDGIWCWGLGADGRLGHGGTASSATPVQVAGLGAAATTLAAGASHTCAVEAGGGIEFWGRNAFGQLGDGSTNDSLLPIAVAGLTESMVAVTAGTAHTCALDASGGAWCWGRNRFGQLGAGSGADTSLPVAVADLASGGLEIDAGDQQTCAMLRNQNAV